MKQFTHLVLPLLLICILLGACGGGADTPSGDPSPELSQAQDAQPQPEAQPAPASAPEPEAPESETQSEDTTDSAAEASDRSAEQESAPGFDPHEMEVLYIGSGYEDPEGIVLEAAERAALGALLRVDEWAVATDLPARGFSAAFYIESAEQVWFFNPYDDQVLVVPSFPDESGEKVCFFAPGDIIPDVLAWAGH